MTAGHKLVLFAAAALAVLAGAAQATTLTVLASDNATVRPAGPRTGASGKSFFNVEGSANGANASYGVADFHFGVLPQTVATVNSVTLQLTESNAAFTTPGTVTIALDTNALPSDIQPGTSPLAFDGADPGWNTDMGQGDLTLVLFPNNPFVFNTLGNVNSGTVDTYTLGVNPAVGTEIANRLNTTQGIRVVIGSGNATVAGTWAGYSNTTYAGPTLVLDVTYGNATPTAASTWGRLKTLYR